MADVTIKYNDITSEMSESGRKILKTQKKYCTGDITVEYTKPSGGTLADEVLSGVFSNPEDVVLNATEIKRYGLAYTNAVKISLPNCEKTGLYSLTENNNLTSIIIPKCENFGGRWIFNCNITKLDASSCKGHFHGGTFLSLMKSNTEYYTFDELKICIKYPYRDYDDIGILENLSGCGKLIMRLDTQDEYYQDALDYILGLDFQEFYLYDEEGVPISI